MNVINTLKLIKNIESRLENCLKECAIFESLLTTACKELEEHLSIEKSEQKEAISKEIEKLITKSTAEAVDKKMKKHIEEVDKRLDKQALIIRERLQSARVP